MDCFANIKIMFGKDFHQKTFVKKCEKHENLAFFAKYESKILRKKQKTFVFFAIKM